MVGPFLGMFYGILSVMLPVLSLTAWTLIFILFFPYSREVFLKMVFHRGTMGALRYIMIGLTPIVFFFSSITSAGLSVLGEAVFMGIIYIFDSSMSPVSQMLSLMSAGPIEESMKLAVAVLVYITIQILWRSKPKDPRRDRVREGMITGCFVGASFGFFESLLYLFSNFMTLATDGPSFGSVDPILWRFILGVMIHALYTGIASAGLGRRTITGKVLITAAFLTVSVVLHALNNGIQGFIVLILEMDNVLGWLISDIAQGLLILIGMVIFIVTWKVSHR
ncbi:MAG: PrsW family intramembrane metalloprotease [Candidatus Thermoplasmatota archaeon]|nr:PrsW family intramembrane metalloprotease [Candidatus Thermoplasmatota archaeon]